MKTTTKKGVMYRLGVYDLMDDLLPVRFIGPDYDSSDAAAEIMEETIRVYNSLVAEKPECTFAMAAFPKSGQCSGH